ncbi:MAG: diguanylate cyclase [Spirochaetota bacterium]
MSDLSDKVKNKLALLTKEFTHQLPQRVQRIRETASLALDEPKNMEKLKELHMIVHKLSGSGATFGFESLSLVSKRLEDLISVLLSRDGAVAQAEYEQVISLLDEIDRECDSNKPEKAMNEINGKIAKMEIREPTGYDEKTVYLIEGDDEHAADLTDQLGFYGYTVDRIYACEVLEQNLNSDVRQVVIINTAFLEKNPNAQAKLAKVKKSFEKVLNIIFVSEFEDFSTRLKAVRAGGDAFFPFPIDTGRLIEKIDSLTSRKDHKPYHILIVDDDQEQVSFYAMILQQAGMITSVASDPRNVIKVLIEAKPELILMDMYMPGCDGSDLAAIIRQQEAFVSIPIVFLSIETDMDKQLAAIRLGGDDFLVKPIKAEHLISSISTRAERSRSMRYFMERDSLTGLLNHSNLKEQLGREVMRAKRTETEICFAMIDIDRFKSVNDKYGHITGDRVIKSLARLLHDRVRSTDIIGRYGGEEFGIIFINSSLGNSQKKMDQIREDFSKIRHQSELDYFFVTFSCGIASYPDFDNPNALNEAADKALYEAKETGRNRIVTARNAGK